MPADFGGSSCHTAHVMPGYLLLTVVGGLLFEITVGGAIGGPDLTATIILAGVCSPAVCAGIGGVGWVVLENKG